jgi:hypothetical protein
MAMLSNNPIEIALAFVEKINAHDVAGLCELMPGDHLFVDALGAVVAGREAMRQGWAGYFALFPDYQISIQKIFREDNFIALFGTAGGTYLVDGQLLPENRWEIPAAWKAIVKDGLISEWRVYADNSPVLRIMQANGRANRV